MGFAWSETWLQGITNFFLQMLRLRANSDFSRAIGSPESSCYASPGTTWALGGNGEFANFRSVLVWVIGKGPFVTADLEEGTRSLMQLRNQRKGSVAGTQWEGRRNQIEGGRWVLVSHDMKLRFYHTGSGTRQTVSKQTWHAMSCFTFLLPGRQMGLEYTPFRQLIQGSSWDMIGYGQVEAIQVVGSVGFSMLGDTNKS